MSKQGKILAFSGSTRKHSFNKMAVHVAAEGAREAGAEVQIIDLADYPMPIYNGDLEDAEGLPEAAHRLRDLFFASDALLIATPEYNGSLPPLLKNTIDWLSRKQEGEGPLAPYKDKTAALIAASPGGLGGVRVLNHLRQVLSNIGVLVLPQQKGVANAGQVFDSEGRITDEKQEAALKEVGANLARFLAR